MDREQYSAVSPPASRHIRYHTLPPRLLFSVLIGAGITVLLMCIEILLIWLGEFTQHTIALTWNSLIVLLVALFHASLFLLVMVVELVVFSLLLWLASRSRRLLTYLRAAKEAQEPYHLRYVPLAHAARPETVATPDLENTSVPTTAGQEEFPAVDLLSQDAHLLLLGDAGMGKTMALREYLYMNAQDRRGKVRGNERIPIYVPLQRYAAYLKTHLELLPAVGEALPPEMTLLSFLSESDLPAMYALRSSLKRWYQRGRLLFLCDGLDEADADCQGLIVAELVELMSQGENRIVLACREADYLAQPPLVQLVNSGRLERVVLRPLEHEQIRAFVESRALNTYNPWQHTVGQVMQEIERSRFRYHCTNPMLLSCLVEIVDRAGIERARQLDTRGRLLREFVAQVIELEQSDPAWNLQAPAASSVIGFLAQLAYAARWTDSQSAVQLNIAPDRRADMSHVVQQVQGWLDEHPVPYPFKSETHAAELYTVDELPHLLQFAQDAGLIDLTTDGLLSFRHELMAQYFVAEYLFQVALAQGRSSRLREDLLLEVERWSGPIALWAGLVENPFDLAGLILLSGRSGRLAALPSLALSLACCGVNEVLPRNGTLAPIQLPASIEDALVKVIPIKEAREELARLCLACAQEGGQEIYRALPLLLTVKSAADFLPLLNRTSVPDLLFSHLVDIADLAAYDEQAKRLVVVLGHFGDAAVSRAGVLSQLAPGRSVRLRGAAIQILGRTGEQRAVELLIPFLGSVEQPIAQTALSALIRLGPECTLPSLLPLLETFEPSPSPAAIQTQQAALTILGHFLKASAVTVTQSPFKDSGSLFKDSGYQQILAALLSLLSTNHAGVPALQQQASNLLVVQGRQVATGDRRGEKVIDLLAYALVEQDELLARHAMQALQDIGAAATSRLLVLLKQQQALQPLQPLGIRIIEVLKGICDPQALPSLLQLLADPSLTVQQHVAAALVSSAPDSISGLIDFVSTHPDEAVASRAAQILISIGDDVVVPVTQHLFPIVPGRTRLLVEVLQHVPDNRAIPDLISLLQIPHLEPLLTVAGIRALGQIPDQQSVPPLLSMLQRTEAQLYEEAISALGHLGEVALPHLLLALDSEQEAIMLARVRRALLCMAPFPAEQLMQSLAVSSDALAEQIMLVLCEQGAEAAQALVYHLLDTDDRVNGYIHQTLASMPGPIVVPALLEVLDRPAWHRVVSALLLKYPEAIPPLVHLLSDPRRDAAAASILPQFGPEILLPLLSGLSDYHPEAQEHAGRVIVALARQRPEVLDQVVQLFGVSPSLAAREVLLDALTGPLADVSLPALLVGLEDAHLIDGVSEALVRLQSRSDEAIDVIGELLQALREPERQRGAETTLIKIGVPAVQPVGNLITDEEPAIARAAQRILAHIGAPAFPFIWASSSDMSNTARREAALNILHQMPARVIQDGLVQHLVSDQPQDVAMALALLLERIHNESQQAFVRQEMIPALLNSVEEQGDERTLLRILALLLFIGGQNVIQHLVQALYEQSGYSERIVQSFLLLGSGAGKTLEDILHDPRVTQELRIRAVGILSMLEPGTDIYEYVRNIASYGYGLTARPDLLANPEMLDIALSALGGLLVGGHWDVSALLDLRENSPLDQPERDLATALLGWHYGPYIQKLLAELRSEREMHRMDVQNLQIEMSMEQKQNLRLQEELENMHQEHRLKVDEMDRKHREMRDRLDHRAQQQEDAEKQMERLQWEKQATERENAILKRENEQLRREVQRLQDA